MTEMINVVDFKSGSETNFDYTVFYHNKNHSNRIDQTFELELTKWHKKLYSEDPLYRVEYPDDNTTTIKYVTQFVSCLVTVTQLFNKENEYDGNNIKISLSKMNSINLFRDDYVELIKLAKKINQQIISENKELNDMFEDDLQELCGIEYAMDHC